MVVVSQSIITDAPICQNRKFDCLFFGTLGVWYVISKAKQGLANKASLIFLNECKRAIVEDGKYYHQIVIDFVFFVHFSIKQLQSVKCGNDYVQRVLWISMPFDGN